MAEKQKTFKGFPLDSRGDVFGAFPSVDVIQQARDELMKRTVENINQLTIDYCLKFNIDPDVLIKQKAEIELLLMKIDKMKVCSNCKHFNKVDDLEYCHNCERQLVNSLDKLTREEIIKDEWELSE